MKRSIRMTINGESHEHEVEPRLLLVHYLRDVVGLTGTHIGCETSICGTCTVFQDGMAVKSCTLLAVQADGSEITTVEGLAKDGALDPVQQSFWDHHGLQCGFCTPGMLIAAKQLLDRNPNPTDEEIRRGIEGNLCRGRGATGGPVRLRGVPGALGPRPLPAGDSRGGRLRPSSVSTEIRTARGSRSPTGLWADAPG